MKHSLVRQTIIETASELFYHNGYNLTGINEIIKEAGVAKATLYNHFKSKNDICLAYLDYRHATFLTGIKEITSSKQVGRNQILALFDFLQMFFEGTDFNGCWCINTISEIPKEEKEIRYKIQSQKEEFMRFINGLVKGAFPDKLETEVVFLERQVYLLYESAVSESYLHQKSWPIDVARGICEKLI